MFVGYKRKNMYTTQSFLSDNPQPTQYYDAIRSIRKTLKEEKNSQISMLCSQDVAISDEEFECLAFNLVNNYNLTVWKLQHCIYNSLSIEPIVLESRICLVDNITHTILHSKRANGKKNLKEIIVSEFFDVHQTKSSNKHEVCEELGIALRTFERNTKFFLDFFAECLKELYDSGDTIVKFIYLAEKQFGIDGKHFCKSINLNNTSGD